MHPYITVNMGGASRMYVCPACSHHFYTRQRALAHMSWCAAHSLGGAA